MLRYADIRIDASAIQELPDGSLKVVGQLTHPGIFSYRNLDGSERREYRPAEEVFRKTTLDTFSASTVTISHPVARADGQRIVTAKTWKSLAIGHLGENVREDGGHMVADVYIRDERAVERVKNGELKFISCGYHVDYDETPGVTPEGQRYDGVQRNIRGNHVALLPAGIAPRGGSECVLRLDSNGDEIVEGNAPESAGLKSTSMNEEALKAQITALQAELAKARTDSADSVTKSAELEAAKAELAALKAQLAPERLDALVEARSQVVAAAKTAAVETAGKSTLQIKRAIVAKRTPALAARVDSLSEESVDSILAVYSSESHPSLASAVAPVVAPANAARNDSSEVAAPKYADLYAKHLKASQDAWKNSGDLKGN